MYNEIRFVMTPTIEFKIMSAESTFLDPRKGFKETTEGFEVRVDPLTGRTGHISHVGAISPQKLLLDDYNTPALKGFCPFCSPHREGKTPRFVERVLPEGRLVRNETVLIPNLFPYDIYNAVAIMTDQHVVPLKDFNEQRLYDSFSVGIEFLKKVKSIEPGLPYHIMAWNYMPPSGGGLVHPHQQYFATMHPGNQFTDELNGSHRFHAGSGINYWSELVDTERKTGDRYIGEIGGSVWLTSFMPLGILGDILCVFPEVFSIDGINDSHVQDLVTGLLRIFKYYEATGIYSFNASLFFGPEGQDWFSCHFRLTPRTFLNTRDHASDLNFFQAILSEPISVVLPEQLCTVVKAYF
jgi:UDPglucose--hexose-1-phosphate uridylyltransferase